MPAGFVAALPEAAWRTPSDSWTGGIANEIANIATDYVSLAHCERPICRRINGGSEGEEGAGEVEEQKRRENATENSREFADYVICNSWHILLFIRMFPDIFC